MTGGSTLILEKFSDSEIKMNLIESYRIGDSRIEIFTDGNSVHTSIEEIKQMIHAVVVRTQSAFRVIASWIAQFDEWSISFRWNIAGQRVGYMQRISLEELAQTYPEILAGEIIYGINQVVRAEVAAMPAPLRLFGNSIERRFQKSPPAFDYIANLIMMSEELPVVHRPSQSAINSFQWLGLKTCKFNAKSEYIRCAVNPSGPCEGCNSYEKI